VSFPPGGQPPWNRNPGRSAADVNLDAAPYGFKVTGDAAWDSSSSDFAMHTPRGNRSVAKMVVGAQVKCASNTETSVQAWLWRRCRRIEKRGHQEIYDTMVRETIAYALDGAWQRAYGHRFTQWAISRSGGRSAPIAVNTPELLDGD
jgi:hypothetical protein